MQVGRYLCNVDFKSQFLMFTGCIIDSNDRVQNASNQRIKRLRLGTYLPTLKRLTTRKYRYATYRDRMNVSSNPFQHLYTYHLPESNVCNLVNPLAIRWHFYNKLSITLDLPQYLNTPLFRFLLYDLSPPRYFLNDGVQVYIYIYVVLCNFRST